MGQLVSGFPDRRRDIQSPTLGDQQIRARFTWLKRCESWYVDLFTLEMSAILLGSRLSPKSFVGEGYALEDMPDGVLYVRGEDGYDRRMLGDELALTYYPAEELPEPAEDIYSELTITI